MADPRIERLGHPKNDVFLQTISMKIKWGGGGHLRPLNPPIAVFVNLQQLKIRSFDRLQIIRHVEVGLFNFVDKI